jgi:8-hydroxy-5-deazaflavin:NADPH oxidoreductase
VSSSTVPIIGGTGALGFGLALRLAREGVPIVIGSRKLESA